MYDIEQMLANLRDELCGLLRDYLKWLPYAETLGLTAADDFLWGFNHAGMSGAPSTSYSSSASESSKWTKDIGWSTPIVTSSSYSIQWPARGGGVDETTLPEVDPDVADWSSFDWAIKNDMRLIRLPITWERLSTDNQTLNGLCVDTLDKIFSRAKNSKLKFIIDIHNNDHHISLNGEPATTAMVAHLWSLIAEKWGAYDNVLFELYNEPTNDIPIADWIAIVEASVGAIRDTGATNKILVDGINYTNVYNGNGSWVEKNGDLVVAVKALADSYENPNIAFSIHQYFDADSSGTADYSGTAPGNGGDVPALWTAFDELTDLLSSNGFEAYLTETNILKDDVKLCTDTDTGTEAAPTDYGTMKTLVDTMKARPDVWKGLCVWQVVFDYSNSSGTGNIRNGPHYDDAAWTADEDGGQPQSTVDWFTNYLR